MDLGLGTYTGSSLWPRFQFKQGQIQWFDVPTTTETQEAVDELTKSTTALVVQLICECSDVKVSPEDIGPFGENPQCWANVVPWLL